MKVDHQRVADHLKKKLVDISFRLLGEGSSLPEVKQELLNIKVAVVQAEQSLQIQTADYSEIKQVFDNQPLRAVANTEVAA